jgi:hypothetical protein
MIFCRELSAGDTKVTQTRLRCSEVEFIATGRHHDLVDRYEISISPMHTTQDRKLKNMSNTDPTKNPGAREG